MGGLGADLRLARERAGLSLGVLSARTKIREQLLDAIEHDDFGRLPAGLLARGYLRAYATEVGLEPESVVRRYRSEFDPPPAPARAVPSASRTEAELLGGGGGGQSWLVAVVLVVITGLFLYLNGRTDAPETDPTQTVAVADSGTRGPEALPAAQTIDKVPAPPQPASPARTDQSGPLVVDIHPTRVVWVQATADGQRVLYSLIRPGAQTTIQAEQGFVLRVGDAGAFEYTINGVRGRAIGAPGEVREVQITRSNYADFLAQAQ